jgi:hypothetical protein
MRSGVQRKNIHEGSFFGPRAKIQNFIQLLSIVTHVRYTLVETPSRSVSAPIRHQYLSHITDSDGPVGSKPSLIFL